MVLIGAVVGLAACHHHELPGSDKAVSAQQTMQDAQDSMQCSRANFAQPVIVAQLRGARPSSWLVIGFARQRQHTSGLLVPVWHKPLSSTQAFEDGLFFRNGHELALLLNELALEPDEVNSTIEYLCDDGRRRFCPLDVGRLYNVHGNPAEQPGIGIGKGWNILPLAWIDISPARVAVPNWNSKDADVYERMHEGIYLRNYEEIKAFQQLVGPENTAIWVGTSRLPVNARAQ